MSRVPLVVEISWPSRAVLRALGYLARDTRLRVSVRRVKAPQALPEPGVLRIEPASLLFPALSLAWGDLGDAGKIPAECMDIQTALSALVWESRGSGWGPGPGEIDDLWIQTAGPLPRYARFGTPDPERPWVLLASNRRSSTEERSLIELAGLEDAQLHQFLATSHASLAPDHVVWLPLRRTAVALLGHVDAVLGAPGPLTWDATRLGVRVIHRRTSTELAALVSMKLRSVVPPRLVEHAEFWKGLATDLVRGQAGDTWGTLAWVREARALTDSEQRKNSAISRLRRKVLKLQRDPRAFFLDSWLIRRSTRRKPH